MRARTPLWLVLPPLALAAFGSVLRAEPPRSNAAAEAAIRQVESERQRAQVTPAPPAAQDSSAESTNPQLYPGESEDLGPQFLLIRKQRKRLFEASADVQYYYTSNFFLSEKGNVDTGVLATTAQVAFCPEPFRIGIGELGLRTGYRHQTFYYGLDSTENQFNNLDFDSETVFFNARYKLPKDYVAFVGLDYGRLLSHEFERTEFFTELAVSWGLEKSIPIGEKNQLSFAYIGSEHFTYSDPAPTTNTGDRTDSIFALSWSSMLTSKLSAQPYYRFQHTHYWFDDNRNDFVHAVGISLSFALSETSSIRFFSGFDVRNSDTEAVDDYHKFDTGGGISISYRF